MVKVSKKEVKEIFGYVEEREGGYLIFPEISDMPISEHSLYFRWLKKKNKDWKLINKGSKLKKIGLRANLAYCFYRLTKWMTPKH
jgi:hypothetical protein